MDVALCTPHGGSAPIARRLLDDDVRVIDLSADFRLDPASYAEWYGDHPHPEMLPGVYGLTELNRDEVAGADLVANPGCYPTAALLALAPLADLGLADVVIDAKSGVSGAGKVPTASTSAASTRSGAYGVRSHRHFPETPPVWHGCRARAVRSRVDPVRRPSPSRRRPSPSSPSAPLQRGISDHLCQVYDAAPPSQDLLAEMYREFYAGETFIGSPTPLRSSRTSRAPTAAGLPQVDERLADSSSAR